MTSRVRVVAIGVDACDPQLVRALADRGDLPTLRGLFTGGASGLVGSSPPVTSASVWPTFMTATGLRQHQKYSFWAWHPDRMEVDFERFDELRPFWRAPEMRHRSVGMLDVPYAPAPAPLNGFEIAEWGTLDFSLRSLQTWPPALASRVRSVAGRYPIPGPLDASAWSWTPADLLDRCLEAVRRRGRLIEHLLEEAPPEIFIGVFPEVHVASHMYWHTVNGADPGPGLVDLFRELDRQLGRVLMRAGDEAAVLVFSLYGMRDGRGVPVLLDPLFRSAGLSARVASPAWPTLRRRVPTALKRMYHRFVSPARRLGLSKYGLIPSYDWSRTKAFPLPTDQHGLIRVNLRGREARGIVEPSDYDRLCGEIERLVSGLRTEDGTPVVAGVVRTVPDDQAALSSRLPDLIIHWAPAATRAPFKLRTPALRCELGASRITGEHSPHGFWVFRSPRAGGPPNGAVVPTESIGRLLVDQLEPS
jgi:predicted AlkP superfamily phosphohydrolase/phosphomutase